MTKTDLSQQQHLTAAIAAAIFCVATAAIKSSNVSDDTDDMSDTKYTVKMTTKCPFREECEEICE